MFALLEETTIAGHVRLVVASLSSEPLDGAVACGASVGVGDVYEGGGFLHRAGVERALAPRSAADELAAAVASKLAEAKANRRQSAQRFVFDGVETDCEAAFPVVTAAVLSMSLAGGAETKLWKLADGVYREFSLPELIAFGRAIEAHIQAGFVNEAVVSQGVMQASAISAAAVAAVDVSVGWP